MDELNPRLFYILGSHKHKVRRRSDLPSILELVKVDKEFYYFADHGTNGDIKIPIGTVNALLPDISFAYTEVRIRYSDGKQHIVQVRKKIETITETIRVEKTESY